MPRNERDFRPPPPHWHELCWAEPGPLTVWPSLREAEGLAVREEPGLCPHPQPFLGPPAGLSGRLVGIFQQTPLGRFLAELGVEQQRELLQCYMKDFLVMTMKVSSGIELEVNTGWGGMELGRMQTQGSLPRQGWGGVLEQSVVLGGHWCGSVLPPPAPTPAWPPNTWSFS